LLRAARTRAGLSQQGLAVAAGLHANAVQHLEVGRTRPMASTAAALADALGISLDALFTTPEA
jgi:transcriptional regulator with XRE-family HTH domain